MTDRRKLVRRLLLQRQYFGGQSWLLQSKSVLPRWIRGAKADPETPRSPALIAASQRSTKPYKSGPSQA